MRFQSPDIRFKKEAMRFAILFAVPTSALFIWFGDILQTRQSYALAAQIVGVTLVMWCAGCLLFDLYVRWGIDLRKDTKTLWRFNKAYIGALIAHMGFLAAILGFLGNYRGYSQELTFQTGETKTFSGYLMTFNGISVRENANVTLFEAVLDLQRNGETLPPLAVAKSRYPTKPELLNEIGVRSTFWKDLYVVMADFDRSTGKSATFQVHANPTVRLVWISVVLLVLGGLVALFDRRRGMRSRDVMFSEGATRAEVIS